MSIILQRARESGKCPPSLLSDEYVQNDDGFDDVFLKMLDDNGFVLRPDPEAAAFFATIKQKVENIERIPGPLAQEVKKKVLDYRRCVLLAAIGFTPNDSPSLVRIVDDGYLTTVKSWLDSILNSPEGNMDLLLHLLSSISQLPVTKNSVKESGMGKTIGDLGKHKICAGTPNETAIKDRIQIIKDAWQASVKARKLPPPTASTETTKRPMDDSGSGVGLAKENQALKKQKTTPDAKKSSSFSYLLKKVNKESNSPTSNASNPPTSTQISPVAGKPLPSLQNENKSIAQNNVSETKAKKTAKRVKWADHFGGQITVSQLMDGEVGENEISASNDNSMSWNDRKKRDRLREKELLQKVKKAKLMDDDDLDLDVKAMHPSVSWRVPTALPFRSDITLPQLTSPESLVQNERIKSIPFIRYSSEHDVPSSPAPLSDVEQALDMTSQSSAIVSSIPFFVVQEPASIAPAVPATAFSDAFQVNPTNQMIQSKVFPDPTFPATADVVQSLGLPLFLVGQPLHALQALANSPGLLSTLVDANGIYDQARLMTLVQTLSSTTGGQAAVSPTSYPQATNGYDNVMASSFNKAPLYQSAPDSRVYRSKTDEGNLHLIGYGPGTTQAEIIAAFSPYVKVDEVVMKGSFSFVNTSDPVNAQRAKEALHGTLIGGMPVRINDATRKARDPKVSQYVGAATSSSFPPPAAPAAAPSNIYGPSNNTAIASNPTSVVPTVPPMPQINADSYRDDKGNPATKNLFVAGYGPGTTEIQLRQLFSQYAQVTGVVLKGTFSFVNTTDRNGAVVARQALSGFRVNGGQLRINFAKETGRLGTSFDLTYNTNTGPNALRNNAGPPTRSLSYYGRGGY